MPKIALIGCGRWGRNILRDLLSLGCSVTVADPGEAARRHAASAGATVSESAAEAVEACDGIVVATPTTTHAHVIESVASRGVPIFVEKPLAPDTPSAARVAALLPGRLFVMDKWRYHPGIEALAAIAQSGELGSVKGMHLRHVGWGNPHSDVDVVWILLPHCLSILLEVLGHIPAVKQAWGEQLNGEAVSLHAVLSGSQWATIEVSGRSPVKQREFRLHCDGGVAWLDEGWSDYIRVARNSSGGGGNAEAEKRSVSAELPLLRELRTFVEHIQGGPAPRTAAPDAVRAVETIEQLRRAAGFR